jgi:hypothetical protein
MSRGLLGLTFMFATLLVTPTARTQSDLLDAEHWPVTMDATIHDLLLHLPASETSKLNRENLISAYPDLGLYIKNRYGLWRGNDQLILSACGARCHPDDAAMKIIEALWRKLQE